MARNPNTDYFARTLSVIGIIVAIVAVALPYIQSKEDEKEKLSIWMRTNQGGVVLVPDNPEAVKAVQVPWLITLSNTGKTTLSIISYNISQMVDDGVRSGFNGLNGLVTDKTGKEEVILPLSIDPGESVTIRVHIGFIPSRKIFNDLVALNKREGAFTLSEATEELARKKSTIYGGVAEFREFEGGGFLISISSDFYEHEPVYLIEFRTGRGSEFYIQTSDTMSKIQQLTSQASGTP